MTEAQSSRKPKKTAGELGNPGLSSLERLSMPIQERLRTITGATFGAWIILGAVHGSRETALRFRAENAHRLPETSAGWYHYHRSKNHHMLLGGLKEGIIVGAKTSLWVGAFFGIEDVIDQVRGGRKDALATTIAGLSVAGGFSAWNGFSVIAAARNARLGLLAGLCYGLLQDAVFVGKGQHIGYADFIFRQAHARFSAATT